MSSGSGRGRGWLKLAKTQAPVKPGVPNSPPQISAVDSQIFTDAPTEYAEFIRTVEQLNEADDGIKFNQKLRYILEFWTKECPSPEEVERSFEALYNACLRNEELSSKLVMMMAAPSFRSQEVNGMIVRRLFLEHLQDNFENAEYLHATSPLQFHNCIHMIGNFYNKGRLDGCTPYKFLVTPFCSCLEMLLDGRDPADLKMFARQLRLNGSTVCMQNPSSITVLLLKIRKKLTTSTDLSPECRLWLLLSLDIANNNFGNLPPDLFQFYEENLGSAALDHIQKAQDVLSVETMHPSRMLDNFKSNVNVLQISSHPEGANGETPNPPHYNHTSHSNNCDYIQNSTSVESYAKPVDKPGRPILGSGARLNKIRTTNSEEDFSRKEQDRGGNPAFWNNKQREGSGWKSSGKERIPKPRNNKGWEHDDRFDNDYS